MAQKVLFDHFPKNGGTSVTKFLEAAAGRTVPHLQGVPGLLAVDLFAEFDIVAGHFSQRVLFPELGIHTITILRDPIERFISTYNFARTVLRTYPSPDEWAASFAVLSPESALASPEFDYLLQNPQTAKYATADNRLTRESTKLEQAKRNLSRYAVVGVLEDISKFFDDCCNRFGWKVNNRAFHENKSDPGEEISPKVREQIRAALYFDCELYDFARELAQGYAEPILVESDPGIDLTIAVGCTSIRNQRGKLTGPATANDVLTFDFVIYPYRYTGRFYATVSLRLGWSLDVCKIVVSGIDVQAGIPKAFSAVMQPQLISGQYSVDVRLISTEDPDVCYDARGTQALWVRNEYDREDQGFVRAFPFTSKRTPRRRAVEVPVKNKRTPLRESAKAGSHLMSPEAQHKNKSVSKAPQPPRGIHKSSRKKKG